MGIFHERSGSASGDEGSSVGTGGSAKAHRRRDSWLAQVRNLFSPTPSIASSERSDASKETASSLAHAVDGLRLADDRTSYDDLKGGLSRRKGPIDIGIETDIFLWEAGGRGHALIYLNKEAQVDFGEEFQTATPPTATPNWEAVDRSYSPIPSSFHQHHTRKMAVPMEGKLEPSMAAVTVPVAASRTETASLSEPTYSVRAFKNSSLAGAPVGPASPNSSTSSNLSSSPGGFPSSNRTLNKRKKRSSGERHIRFSNFACLLDAAWQGDLEEVRKMIEEENVSPDACNADGVTALHCAAASANYPMVEYLLEAGANVNVADDHGWTPLHSAAYNNHHETVELLLAYGADVEALDSQGQTPISLPTDIEMIRNFGDIVSRKNNAEWLVALYDFCGEDVENAEGDELDFSRGDRLRILRRDDANWWLAEREDGSALGYVPRQFVQ